MFISSKEAEEKAVMDAAFKLCAAARTAPKAGDIHHLHTAAITA